MPEPALDPAFEELLEFLRTSRGFDFTGYKRASLMRRVTKRMQSHGIEDFARYLDYLQVHQDEFTELFDVILINVTSFFRDRPVWDYLAEQVVPALVEQHRAGPIRIWCAGCASGEEAYSLAMLMAEHVGDEAFRQDVKIYATDADDEAVAVARLGLYPDKAFEGVEPERVERFFEPAPGGRAFRRDLRRSLIFGRHDLVQDAPISRTDLISCRNTLMYLNADTQARVMEQLRFSLKPGGLLVLGKSEMLFTKIREFAPVDLKRRVFAKADPAEDRGRGDPWRRQGVEAALDPSRRLSGVAFEEASVSQILVATDGRLLMANRRARALFGVREDDLGRPLQDLDLSFRPIELRGPIEQAARSGRPVQLPGVKHRTGDGVLTLDVEITPLAGEGGPTGSFLSFVDVSEAHRLRQDLETSNQELETAMEELQSTNEELETMNEELQSTNEELHAVNTELRDRTHELSGLNRFMASILSSVRAGVVVLDADLRVREWNSTSEDLWGLRGEEVKGRPFLTLDFGLPLEPVLQQIHRARSGDGAPEAIVLDAVNRRGRAIRCRISCSLLDDEGGEAGVILLMETAEHAGGSG